MYCFHTAEEQFVKLNKAHEVLLNPETRNKYDKWTVCGLNVSFEEWLGLETRLHAVRMIVVSLTTCMHCVYVDLNTSQCTGEEQERLSQHYHSTILILPHKSILVG